MSDKAAPTTDELRDRIASAIADMQTRGMRVMTKGWGVEWDGDSGDIRYETCLCPLGCVAVSENAKAPKAEHDDEWGYNTEPSHVMATHLGVSHEWVYGFICGFDGDGMTDEAEASLLGRHFRAAISPVSAEDFEIGGF